MIKTYNHVTQTNYERYIDSSDTTVHMVKESKDVIEEFLKKHGVDDLTIQDIVNQKQRIKIELFPNYLFAVYKPLVKTNESLDELYISVVMFEDKTILFYDDLRIEQFLIESDSPQKQVFNFIDLSIDHALILHESLNETVIDLEESMLDEQEMDQETFYLMRKELFKLRNSIEPIEDHFERGYLKKLWFKNAIDSREIDDTIDHIKRLNIHLEQARELMRQLLDFHINNQSNKMNKIMTTLTLFSAIFIPLSFLTGFFGMNFVDFQILEYDNAVMIFLVACLTLAVLMLAIFKKMKWF